MADYPEVFPMIINSTDLKNNLGKYLLLSAREEIIVTSNGRKAANRYYHDNYLHANGRLNH
jgi:hypothetical protein